MIGNLLKFALDTGEQGEIISRKARVGKEDFVYQQYVPPAAKQAGKMPVVVFLHGIRERGRGGYISGMFAQIVRQYLKPIPGTVLFPQCDSGKYWSDAVMDAMVSRAIEQTFTEFDVDERRIYLIGVSMGGYGVWHFASQYPKKFAALVSICGGSPILSGERFASIAEKVGKTPAWIFHGADDPIVPVSESREMVKALQANEGNVKYSEYERVGHNVWLNALAEKNLLPWLLAQTRAKNSY
jgi:predicted peptidase